MDVDDHRVGGRLFSDCKFVFLHERLHDWRPPPHLGSVVVSSSDPEDMLLKHNHRYSLYNTQFTTFETLTIHCLKLLFLKMYKRDV